MSDSSEPNLLGLPAELRNRIYEFALFHAESDGIIAPVQDKRTPLLYSKRQCGHHVKGVSHECRAWPSMTMISEERVVIVNNKPQIPGDPKTRFEWSSQDAARAHAENLNAFSRLQGVWEESANRRSDHLCTLDCLVQPPLTFVSRQVRTETLPIFYGVNKFHIEMSNFIVAMTYQWLSRTRSPADWWRAIGDSNLGNIDRLNVFGQCDCDTREHGVMVKYRRDLGYLEIRKTYLEVGTEMDYGRARAGSVERYRPKEADGVLEARFFGKTRDYKALIETMLQPHVGAIRARGLHVSVLECIVAELEPLEHNYLRDYSAIEEFYKPVPERAKAQIALLVEQNGVRLDVLDAFEKRLQRRSALMRSNGVQV